jgi:SET domain-containing protein
MVKYIKNKMGSLDVIEVESFLYDMYIKHYKSKLKYQKCGLNNKKYVIDYLKMEYLSSNFEFNLNKVEVKESNIHGVGVFAKQNILSGELITFYPGDIVEYNPNEDRHIPGHITTIIKSKSLENQFPGKTYLDLMSNDYAFDINTKYTMMGHPYFKECMDYVGHLINDGAKSNSTLKSNEIYYKISKIKQNCDFYSLKDLHIAIIATKNINIGEELFIHYGIGYWESYNKK